MKAMGIKEENVYDDDDDDDDDDETYQFLAFLFTWYLSSNI